ncbi:MAG: hypothetical protein WC227_02115 [Patescibacteria group bacterium]|jgi:hypothetical protein
MDKLPVVQSALITSRNRSENRGLICEKIGSDFDGGNFLFYLIDLPFSQPEDEAFLEKLNQVIMDEVSDKESFQPKDFDDILSALNNAICKEAEQTDLKSIFSLNMLIGIVSGRDILLSQTGKIVGYIFRNNRISSLINQEDSEAPTHPGKIFSDIVSGDLSSDDRLIFATKDTYGHLPLSNLKEVIKLHDPAKEVMGISGILRKSRVKSVGAIVIFADNKDEGFAYLDENLQCVFTDDDDPVVKNIKSKFSEAREKSRVGALVAGKSSLKFLKQLLHQCRKQVWPKILQYVRKNLPKAVDQVMKAKAGISKNFKSLEESENYKKIKIKAVAYAKHGPSKSFFGQIAFFCQNCFGHIDKVGIVLEKNNRKYLYIFLILVALSTGYFKISENNEKREAKISQVRLDGSYDQAKTDFENFKNDLALHKSVDYKKIFEILSTAENARSSSVNGEKALILVKNINEFIDDKTNTVRYYTSPFAAEKNITKIALVGSQIYGISNEGIISLSDARDKSSKPVATISGMGQPINLTFSKQENTILVLTDQQKVLSMTLDSNTISEFKVTDDLGAWERSAAITTYATNIYLLDSETGQVWKHTKKDDGFAKGSKYADTRKISLIEAKDMAVDGNIFVLEKGNRVAKFVRGSLEQDFALRDIPSLIDQDKILATKIYTDDETSNLFVFDSNAGKILRFDKAGNFQNQYVFDGVKLQDFVVNTKLQKIWGLGDNKIYEGSL